MRSLAAPLSLGATVLLALTACGPLASPPPTPLPTKPAAANPTPASARAQIEGLVGSVATPRAAAPVAAAVPAPTGKQYPNPPAMQVDRTKQYTATIETTLGTMTAELFVQEAPVTVNNFVFLAREDFYKGVPFHRVIKGFMAQTGDPTGTGRGGPGYRFQDEPVQRKYERGTLAMANAGPNTNGSQFFIIHQDYPLPPNYTIFGKVTEGLDVLDKIANVPVRPSPTGEPSVPQQDVRILDVRIQEA